MANHFRKMKLPLLWLLSYISILLIPLAACFFIYRQSVSVIMEETVLSQTAVVSQTQQTVDSRLVDMQSLAYQVGLNANINSFMFAYAPLQEKDYYSITQIMKDLGVYNTANTFVDNFFVYFRNSNIIIGPQGSYTPEWIYSDRLFDSAFTYNQWREWMNIRHDRQYYHNGDPSDRSTIYYLHSFSKAISADSDAVVVMQILPAEINHLLEGFYDNENLSFFIFDSDANLIHRQGTLPAPLLTEELLENRSPVVYYEVGGANYAMFSTPSQVNNWFYVCVQPTSVYLQKITQVKKHSVISIMLCILLGAVAASIFVKKQYHPVNALSRMITEKSSVPFQGSKNELQYIQDAILQTFEQKEWIASQLDHQRDAVQEHLITRLVLGRLNKDIINMIVWSKINFSSDLFCVILFEILPDHDLFLRESRKAVDLRAEASHSVKSRMLGQESLTGKPYFTEIDNILVALINLPCDAESHPFSSVIEDIVKAASTEASATYPIAISAFVSNIHSTFQGIPTAYEEAIETMDNRLMISSRPVLTYREVQDMRREKSLYHYPLETEEKLLNLIKSGDRDAAISLVQGLLEANLVQNGLSSQMLRVFLMDISGTMAKSLFDADGTQKEFWEQLAPIDQLLQAKTIDELGGKLSRFISEICNYLKERNALHHTGLGREILHFIKEHVSDADLCVTMIADHFDMSPSAVSKYFKEHMKVGLLDTINRCRTAKAKELLQDQAYTVKDIACATGFSNSNAFIRVFRKYEGITPGAYKNLHIHR